MLIQSSYNYILIGLRLRYLQNVTTYNLSKDATEIIVDLKKGFIEAGFQVSASAMDGQSYSTMNAALASIDPTHKLDAETVKLIKGVFATIEKVVFAEATIKNIYVLPNRRFNSEYLLNEPAKLLRDGAFDKLEEIAKVDITSACRCILFGEATAAAFHALRATESVLKSYYFHHRKQNRLDKPMWAGMIEQLRAKKKNKPPETLLDSLDIIRKAYRNPTQHPEAVYEIDGAQDLFGVCLDSIGKMAVEL